MGHMRGTEIEAASRDAEDPSERPGASGLPSGSGPDRTDTVGVGTDDPPKVRTRQARWAYIFGSSREGPLKIGMAKMPRKRLIELQTGHPHKLFCYWMESNPDGEIIERLTHQILEPRNLNGEWFDVPIEVAIAAMVMATIAYEESGVTYPDAERVESWRRNVAAQCDFAGFDEEEAGDDYAETW
jgi:hypothetical protein